MPNVEVLTALYVSELDSGGLFGLRNRRHRVAVVGLVPIPNGRGETLQGNLIGDVLTVTARRKNTALRAAARQFKQRPTNSTGGRW